jgi:phosphate uptake regulator
METRKVQRVGYSTLTVSLPHDWVKEVGLKQGDVVSIRRDEDGSLRLFCGLEQRKDEVNKCIIDADLCDSPNLLTRVITGNYIMGHDTIQIVSKKGLSPRHLEEVRKATQSLTGLDIVEQTARQITVQSFVDPTKFPLYGLLRRLHVLVSSMQENAIRALVERRSELANEVIKMENEADRIYWLIVRQLLLAMRDRTVGARIGIESPINILGNRLASKIFEEIADSSEKIAKEVLALQGNNHQLDSSILDGISKISATVQSVLDRVMRALLTVDIKLANDTVELIDYTEKEGEKVTEEILIQIRDVRAAMTVRSVLSSLCQIVRLCKIVGEITLNRALEYPSDICKFEMLSS